MRKTKIICTIGPAVDNDRMIKALIQNGMDAARMNFSHGSHDEHKARIERIRKIAAGLNTNIPIILDTKGPEIRTKTFKGGSAVLKEGSLFTLYAKKDEDGDENGVTITYPYLAENVEKGTRILIDDGLCALTVEDIEDGNVVCRVTNSENWTVVVPLEKSQYDFLQDKDSVTVKFHIKSLDSDFRKLVIILK